MAIQIQKVQKAAEKMKDQFKKADEALTVEEREAVDRLLILHGAIEAMTPTRKEYDKLKALLASVAADDKRFDVTQPAVLHGFKAVVEFTEPVAGREIVDMHNLIGKIKSACGGYEKMLPLIKLTLKDVDQYLTPAEQSGLVAEKTGARRFKSVHD